MFLSSCDIYVISFRKNFWTLGRDQDSLFTIVIDLKCAVDRVLIFWPEAYVAFEASRAVGDFFPEKF
jgi:hypothetical protein